MRITENFSMYEFACKDGSPTPKYIQHRLVKLAIQLQVLRDYLQEPIKINSGYRTPEYNKRIGGVPNSQHTQGFAADIVCKNKSPREVYDAIEYLINKGEMLQGGLGLYKGFVHYDIGMQGRKRRW